ncbi:hypothetical protein B0H21DRAFT_825760 [Amylocystis lapponica]|nr:hypothetical protein B0H21DRAFT_825760 [Amylocystis lapponica]
MSSLPDVDAALCILREAVSKYRKKDKKRLSENIDQVSSHFVLLNFSTISSQASQKLVLCFRRPLVPVYAAFSASALQLSASIFHKLYHEKVLSAIGNQALEQKALWEAVLNSLISGVLDFLDEHEDSVDVKEAIASALYPTLCDICFSLTAPMMSVELRCTAYSLLSDSAAKHVVNQRRLRDKDTLGGERIGSLIWRTKDYLALESLLHLFACVLPSTNNSATGRAKRTAFIQTVFVSSPPPESAAAGQTVADILEHVLTSQWEETALKIVNVLAIANITFPQPFPVNEVLANQISKPTDRLYIDDKAFVANILVGDDQYDSLSILFSTVCKIDIVRQRPDAGCEDEKTKVNVLLSSPPTVGREPLPRGQAEPSVSFAVKSTDVERLIKALQSRGLDSLIKDNALPKLSLAKSPAVLEFDSHGRPVELSQDERIENVSQFGLSRSPEKVVLVDPKPVSEAISTDLESSCNSIKAKGKNGTTPPTKTPPSKSATAQLATIYRSSGGAILPNPIMSSGTTSLARSHTKVARDAVFGASDEELSEISDADAFSAPSQGSKPMKKSGSALIARRSSTVQPLELVKVPRRDATARRILDSDNEDDTPPARTTRRANDTRTKRGIVKKKAVTSASETSEDEADTFPTTTGKGAIVTPTSINKRSPAVPATPVKEHPGRPVSGVSSAKSSARTHTRVDSVSKSGMNASSTAKASIPAAADSLRSRKSASRVSAAVSRDTTPKGILSTVPAISDNYENTAVSWPELPVDSPLRSSPLASKGRDIKASDMGPEGQAHDNALSGSSPVPVVKIERKSIKARMRKKDEPLSGTAKTTPRREAKTIKRKRTDDDEPRESIEMPNMETRSTKKPRTTTDDLPNADRAIPSERTESQVLRPRATAATRATKRYRAKKDRTSSPIPGSAGVDYDVLPGPPTTTSRAPSSPPSTRRTEKPAKKATTAADPPAVLRRTRAGATLTNKENKPATVETSKPKVEPKPRPLPKQKTPIVADEVEEKQEMPKTLPDMLQPITSSPAGHVASAVAAKKAADTTEILSITKGKRSKGKSAEKPQPLTLPSSARKSNQAPWDSVSVVASASNPTVDLQEQVPVEETLEDGYAFAHDADDYDIPVSREYSSTALESRKDTTQVVYKPNVENTVRKDLHPSKIVATHIPVSIPVSPSHDLPLPIARQSVTIDLTKDDSPVKTKISPKSRDSRTPSPTPSLELGLDDMPHQLSHSTPFRTVASRDSASPPLVKPSRSRHSVTFAPEVKERRPSPSTLSYLEQPKSAAKNISARTRSTHVSPNSILKKSVQSRTYSKDEDDAACVKVGRTQTPGIEDIADVLAEISQVIMQRIGRRLEGVRDDIRAGREALLAEAASDLFEMRAESVGHFNRLIDLEAEYAKFGRSIIDGFEDMTRLNQEICGDLGRTVEDHDRNTMSKKMPVSLFPAFPPRLVSEQFIL